MSVHWFANSWWTDIWGWRTLGLLSIAIGCEAVWGAVKFGGGWTYAYGSAALLAFALGAAFFRTVKS